MKKKPTPKATGNRVSYPTATRLKKFVTGKLDDHQQTEVEDLIRRDSFLAEAMEGYENHPEGFQDVRHLLKIWKKRHLLPGKSLRYFLYGSILAVIPGFIFLYLTTYTPENDKHTASLQAEQEIVHNPNEKTGNIQANSDPNLSIVDTKSPTKSSQSKNSQLSNEKSGQWNRSDIHYPEKFEAIGSHVLETGNQISSTRQINYRSGYESMIIYLHDFKIINYAPALSAKYAEKEFIKTGVDSRFENQNEYRTKPNKLAEDIRPVSYVEFLTQTMYLFKNEYYTEARGNFKEILNYHPEDLNAYFYTGLIDYYQGNYDEAIPNFILVKEHTINLFAEEAEWYEALCLEKLNQPKNARELFEKITEAKGFYAARAKEKLK